MVQYAGLWLRSMGGRIYSRTMQQSPLASLASRLRQRRLERAAGLVRCSICQLPVPRATARREEGGYSCSEQHADELRAVRAW